MKKSFCALLIFGLLFTNLFSQNIKTDVLESESFENEESGIETSDTNESDSLGFDESDDFSEIESENLSEFDDLDLLFEDAEDLDGPVVDEDKKADTPIQIVASAFSSMVHFSGHFSGDIGLLYVKDNDEDKDNNFTGFLSLNNTLNMTVSPIDIFAIRGSVDTGIGNGFNISVSSLYFDYLLWNHIYISAGKRGVSWGNLRLFNSGYYGGETHSGGLYCTGPKHVDIFAEDGAMLALQISYPWSFGTLTFATTGSVSSSIKPDDFNYYGSLEVSIFNTNFNLYAKRPAKNTEPKRTEIFGLEVKRTILGFDTYAQGIVRVKDFKNLNHSTGYDYIVATAGIYRLFDSFDPNIGFNIEFQHEYDGPTRTHYNRVAFEGGVKRIGKQKNMKVGVLSHYTITEKHGFSGLNFVVSGILPYVDWSTKFAIGYGSKYTAPIFMISSSLSIALDY